MHLKQLKLAGFKSFVEPTVVPFPSQLVAVVGPNGCGKSNVIDAVRWVMGESSAKNLRGESMVDVIFNGSSTRNPVGLASVELIFDNSMGRLTGQYSSYQEISVKRIVSRDGDSSYFLNGTRCRRRDITDIFLGMGIGVRGYSIVGQGTISRLVEARPEELRAYFEEAAGVSKYKERRRETVLRIEHTRENLARIADVRQELDKQLQRLERQARAAKRYQQLKQEEQVCKGEILALKWKALSEEQALIQQNIERDTLQYEQHQANAALFYKESMALQNTLQAENEEVQHHQTTFYQLSTEIALLEENIQQSKREQQRLYVAEQQLKTDWRTLSTQLENDEKLLGDSEENFSQVTTTLQSLKITYHEKQQAHQEIQQQQVFWQERWNKVQTSIANETRQGDRIEINLKHLQGRRHDIQLRLEKIQQELKQINENLHAEMLTEQKESLLQGETTFCQQEQSYQELQLQREGYQQQLSDTETQLHKIQDHFHHLKAQQASLTARLNTALSQENTSTSDELWSQYPRLIERIVVEKDWQDACEFVLGSHLKAFVVDSMEALLSNNALLSHEGTNVFTTSCARSEKPHKYPRLSEKIQGVIPSSIPPLDKIFLATDLTQACEWLPFINEDESIITQTCCWLGKSWLRMKGTLGKKDGSLLASQQQLTIINQEILASEAQISFLKDQRTHLSLAVKVNKDNLNECQSQLTETREQIRTFQAEINNQERLLQQLTTTKTRLIDEYEQSCLYLEDMVLQLGDDEQALQKVQTGILCFEKEQSKLAGEKITWVDSLSLSQEMLEETRAKIHKLELQSEREQLFIHQTQRNIERNKVGLGTLNARLEEIIQQLMALETPDSSLHRSLKENLLQYRDLEKALMIKRERLNHLTEIRDEKEIQFKAEEKFAKIILETIQQQQLQLQTLRVRSGSLLDSLNEMNVQVNIILASIPPGITVVMRENELLELADKIKHLGAINLVAIEEFDTESQRKHYLDQQYQDLTEALAMLDAAIVKMDKETTQRLQQTFNEVNEAFQALFPRLFGGGRAMLELTCDNLLEAGILVMAQPPGKRNSTIHLLSGGEKAMTAVALIFAIFQLNPSPFCMLDEVDAPLDDVNVGRFCALVKEMSQFVQFLFITHNKVTMELAEHLIGVTMREPGVSRIVAVDMEQALGLAEA